MDKKVGLYAGSFNPFHFGHADIIRKALFVFDQVVVAKYNRPFSDAEAVLVKHRLEKQTVQPKDVTLTSFTGMLHEFVDTVKPAALIRGLRNGNDLQYEMNQLYWNEDLGVKVPTVYFICDRTLSHVSSSALREIECIREKQSSASRDLPVVGSPT